VVKNLQEKTYLRVTPAQWAILRLFEEQRMVPAALGLAIRERLCPRLGEFYELILKAERAGILLGPERTPRVVEVCPWRASLNPRRLAFPLGFLLLVGLGLALGFRPELPSSLAGLSMGALILVVASNLSEYVRGCLLHGAGGEVYQPRGWWWRRPPAFRIDTSDAVMLPRQVQDVLLVTDVALLAAAAGITAWQAPAWSFLPLLGLMLKLEPGLGGGRFRSVLRLGREEPLSDAEHSFLFPPNRTPRARWQALLRGLRQLNTWVRFGYAVIWTLAVVYLATRLTGTPSWNYDGWETQRDHLALAIPGSLLLLALAYAAWELILFTRRRGPVWSHSLGQWRTRWWSGRRHARDDAGRLEAIARAPSLRPLDATERQELARAFGRSRHGPWRALPSFAGLDSPLVGLIVSGRVAVRRESAAGRARRMVLGPGDLIGLHDTIDPQGATYQLRSLSPVTLLTLPRAAATDLILNRVPRSVLVNMVLKVPFLRGIFLCRNWHQQAVERFAQVSTLDCFPAGETIFSEGQVMDRFFILFEGDAQVSWKNRAVGMIHTGEFFGEIGLLQNSSANATVTARRNTRTLTIARTEFVRFVTHNYAVALELERVSSKRLGRPIFPVRQSDLGDRMQL
jgi:CRP-like cAMP-binding protein